MDILFADNDLDFLNIRAEFLENAGYRVLKAPTLEQARQLLAKTHIHLVILDLRMMDDDDEKDVSGLALAKDQTFRSVPKLILTGFPTYEAVREALGPAMDGLPAAVDFLAKQEGPKALIQAVERVLAAFVKREKGNHVVVIEAADKWQIVGLQRVVHLSISPVSLGLLGLLLPPR